MEDCLAVLAAADLDAIEQLQRRWLACEAAGRGADVLDLCSNDVVWLPPGQSPIRGKAAIRAWLETSHDRVEDIQVSNVTIDGHTFGAYKLANFRTRIVPDGTKASVTVAGWHLWILKRDTDSHWQVAVVVWSLVES